MINQDEALAIAVEWAKRAEAEAAELRAKLAAYEGTSLRRVTEVAGALGSDYDRGCVIHTDDPRVSVSMRDVVPEGVEGKRGRYRVIVEFTPEP